MAQPITRNHVPAGDDISSEWNNLTGLWAVRIQTMLPIKRLVVFGRPATSFGWELVMTINRLPGGVYADPTTPSDQPFELVVEVNLAATGAADITEVIDRIRDLRDELQQRYDRSWRRPLHWARRWFVSKPFGW